MHELPKDLNVSKCGVRDLSDDGEVRDLSDDGEVRDLSDDGEVRHVRLGTL